jgi:hypothetical protein
MRTIRFVAVAVLSTIALTFSSGAQTVIPVGHFRSVALQNGGDVILRHGPAQRVTVLKGSARCTQIRVVEEQLEIDNHNGDCPRHERIQIEVVTPQLVGVSVTSGGLLRSIGTFPVQLELAAAVEQGGTIDVRSIAADDVAASVYSGGRIFTSPRKTLAATVLSGGGITYWGDVRVRKSVRDGGVVSRGAAEDAGKPLSEWNLAPPPIPPLPPTPPI